MGVRLAALELLQTDRNGEANRHIFAKREKKSIRHLKPMYLLFGVDLRTNSDYGTVQH